ncbi:hypothetical protein H2199_008830 [Coniosporium tulheliwenetii]|uniref:Uncharacterized protein n=1 Tax=Coniosporium tulheliwenetii TaxID=3383036 RepID=A0ACC2YHH0_9PEZI|nr:hypothetical protein H2199_008830 [Cladosporium sp. JES 115]
MLYPILDYTDFMQQALPKVTEEGFGDGCFMSLIALLVFALGKVAIEGTFGKPTVTKDGSLGGMRGSLSGIRGGTADEPPALDIFNEAQRRLGFVISHICLETAQILLLKATYFEACLRHIDFWRTTVMASEAIQIILKRPIEWTSHNGDMIKRAYWVCNIIEGWYHVDLDLPQTGISEYQDDIPLPLFPEQPEHKVDYEPSPFKDKRTHYQYNFLGMIAIRRLIDRINNELYNVSNPEPREGYAEPPIRVIKELDHQLKSWRSHLPQPLQWSDEQRTQYVGHDPLTDLPSLMQFTVDRDGDQFYHFYNIDVIIAQLRGRFYYCRFMIYRPFLYKALHFPERMTAEDIEYCTIGLDSCLLWPVCMWPVKNKKRLIPNIFAWTQSFLGILLVLRIAAEDTVLKQIWETQLLNQHVQDSIEMMLYWVRDMQQVDGIAEWSWKILEPLYEGVHFG